MENRGIKGVEEKREDEGGREGEGDTTYEMFLNTPFLWPFYTTTFGLVALSIFS